MSDNFNLGERIHELRTVRGLSQEQLALHANITTTYLGCIERNLKNPTIKVIEKLCSALNISLNDFFNGSSILTDSIDPISNQILAQLYGRTDEEKQLILQTIKDILKLRDLAK